MGNESSLKVIKKTCCAIAIAAAILFQATGTASAAENINTPSEPNDTLEQANPITVNTDITDTFESANDRDCYEFSISKPGSITLQYSTYHYTSNPNWSVEMTIYQGPAKTPSYVFGYSYQSIYSSSGLTISSSSGSRSGHLNNPGEYYVCLTGSPESPLTHTLNVQYSEDVYNVEYSPNNGEPSSFQKLHYGDLATAPSDPTRTGYTFQGWYTSAEGGEKWDFTQPVTSSMTLFAHWKANIYTVSFDSDGGSAVESQSVQYGSKVTQPSDPTRTGYTFQGWYTTKDGGSKYDFGQTVTDNVTLYARWAKEPATLKRLAGETRYDTMESLVGTAFTNTTSTVIVASGANYPDALAASALAGVKDAPIVLTDPYDLSIQAASQLKRLKPSEIIVVGGTGAVSSNVISYLQQYANSVSRVQGATRYDTSYQLYLQGKGGWGSTAIVATGANYADALSVSSYAYAAKAPVFLVNPETGLTQAQKAALRTFKQVLVVGGENAVPSRHVAGLPGVTRLSGATRYETSERIAEWTTEHGLDMDGVVYATGANFPDALAAGPLAGKAGAVTLLVEDAHSPAVSFSAGYRGKVDKAYVVGGVNAVSQNTADAIADSLGLKHAQ